MSFVYYLHFRFTSRSVHFLRLGTVWSRSAWWRTESLMFWQAGKVCWGGRVRRGGPMTETAERMLDDLGRVYQEVRRITKTKWEQLRRRWRMGKRSVEITKLLRQRTFRRVGRGACNYIVELFLKSEWLPEGRRMQRNGEDAEEIGKTDYFTYYRLTVQSSDECEERWSPCKGEWAEMSQEWCTTKGYQEVKEKADKMVVKLMFYGWRR